MASREEWCADKLSKLLNEDLRISTLNEIKEHFQEIPNTEAIKTAELLELPLVFDCLNNSNKEQVDLACEVLSLCLERLDIAQSTTRYSVPLERALTHPNPGVKLMALEEIKRIMKCDEDEKQHIVNVLSKRLLFSNIVRCIGDADIGVALAACSVVTCFAAVWIDCILTTAIYEIIKELMATNEVVRLRIYEVLIDICLLDRKIHNKIITAGYLSPIMQEINSKDVLLIVNIVEMLYKLVEVNYGYEYLEAEGFIQKVFKQLTSGSDPLFAQLCEPGVLKFFGHMAHCKPVETISKYPQIIDRVFENIESNDSTLTKVSLETVAYISTKDKVALNSLAGRRITDTIKLVSDRLQTLPTKDKVTSLGWMEELLKRPENDSERSSEISHSWFKAFSEDPMDLVLHYVRNPFEELRVAGLGVLLSLTDYRWGHECIKGNGGLIEYLLDRSAETSKVSKDLKYNIVESLYRKDFRVFNNAVMTQFEAFVKEGPHYVHRVTEVAVEGND